MSFVELSQTLGDQELMTDRERGKMGEGENALDTVLRS